MTLFNSLMCRFLFEVSTRENMIAKLSQWPEHAGSKDEKLNMNIYGVLPVSCNFASYHLLLRKDWFKTACKKAIIHHFMHKTEVIKEQYSTETLKPKPDIIGFQYCCQIILIVTGSSVWFSGRKNNLSLLVLTFIICNINFRIAKL